MPNNHFDCNICGIHDEGGGIGGWSVDNELWKSTMGDKSKMIVCISCFEKILGRKLSKKDFTDTEDNKTNLQVINI
jgi:hypothetical protein